MSGLGSTRQRTLIAVTLHLSQRWAVGAVPDASDEVTMPVMVDHLGPAGGGGHRPYLPGTTLAGSLRAHLADGVRQRWLGEDPPGWEESGGACEYSRSALRLLGSKADEAVVTAGRGVTRVAEHTAAAYDRSLRQEQFAGPGEVVVCAEHDGLADRELLDALWRWSPILGRGASTGMGQASVVGVRWVSLDLSTAAHLTWWLTGRRHAWFFGGEPPPAPSAAGHLPIEATDEDADGSPPDEASGGVRAQGGAHRLLLDLHWEVIEPVHVGRGESEATTAQQTGGFERQHTLASILTVGGHGLVPGSSWKGIFRHRIAFILRACGADDPTVERVQEFLFGSTSRRGALVFADADLGVPGDLHRTHVPIDRFTGGAIEGGLHTVAAVPRAVRFRQAIETRSPIPPPLRNLLLHVVADLSDGLIGVGRGTSRGYGRIRADGAPRPVAVDLEAIGAAVADGEAAPSVGKEES